MLHVNHALSDLVEDNGVEKKKIEKETKQNEEKSEI